MLVMCAVHHAVHPHPEAHVQNSLIPVCVALAAVRCARALSSWMLGGPALTSVRAGGALCGGCAWRESGSAPPAVCEFSA